MKPNLVIRACLIAFLAGIPLYGQDLTPAIQVNVPFQFTIENKTIPPGEYRISQDDEVIKIEAVGRSSVALIAPILTRLAKQPNHVASAVFDKSGDEYVLSELWIPGLDGYVLRTTTAKHQHEIVRAKG